MAGGRCVCAGRHAGGLLPHALFPWRCLGGLGGGVVRSAPFGWSPDGSSSTGVRGRGLAGFRSRLGVHARPDGGRLRSVDGLASRLAVVGLDVRRWRDPMPDDSRLQLDRARDAVAAALQLSGEFPPDAGRIVRDPASLGTADLVPAIWHRTGTLLLVTLPVDRIDRIAGLGTRAPKRLLVRPAYLRGERGGDLRAGFRVAGRGFLWSSLPDLRAAGLDARCTLWGPTNFRRGSGFGRAEPVADGGGGPDQSHDLRRSGSN